VQPRWERGGYILRPTHHVLLSQIEQFSIAVASDHEDVLDSLSQHEDFAVPPEGRWFTENDNPRDPEYERWASTFGKERAREQPTGASGTRWELDSSLTASGDARMMDTIWTL
jgi:hypothetical protein